MKSLFVFLLLIPLLSSCDALNSRIFDGDSKTKSGAASNPGGSGGGLGGGDIPIDDPTNRCQHPGAFNYNPSYHSDDPGPCVFYACKDVYYAEAHIVAEYYDYVKEFGGEIVHVESLCKNADPGPENCQHPDAMNFLQPGGCEFEACGKEDYVEYDVYLRFSKYVEEKGKGSVKKKNGLCKTKRVIAGCRDPKAIERNKNAKVDNGTCKYAFCSDPNYEEFKAPQNNAILVHAKKYAENWGHDLAFVQGVNTCKKSVDDQKCEDSRASNYKKKELCVFKACNKKEYKEYDFFLEISSYLAQNPGNGKLIIDNSLCKKKVDDNGCMEESAVNASNSPKCKKDDGSCKWDLCLNPKFKEYQDSANQVILQIIKAYAKKHKIDKFDLVRKSTCKTPVDQDDKKGCTNSNAENYDNKAKIENKSCKFEVCLDCRYKEHSEDKNINVIKAMNKYASEHGLELHQIIKNSTCKRLRDKKGCMIPIAINYDRYATVESGSCKFKACINCRAYQYPEYDQEVKDIIYDYYYWLKAQGKKDPKVVVYNTCNKKKFLLRTILDDKCLLKSQGAIVRVRINGKVVMENVLTTAQREAASIHVMKGDSYVIEIVSEGENSSQYSIDNKGMRLEGKVKGHRKHKVYCSKVN